MFVNIPSRIVEIQQYFVAINPYFLNLFSVCWVLSTSSCIYLSFKRVFFV
jgi:hypothetical protein